MSHDRVWEKSDIDLLIIARDEKDTKKGECRSFALVENGVNIHASVQPRSQFKRLVEGSLQRLVHAFFFAKSRLLFTRDETIRSCMKTCTGSEGKTRPFNCCAPERRSCLASIRRRNGSMRSMTWTTPFYGSCDCVSELARIEVFLANQIAGREVVQQALELNPKLFKSLYTDLINQKKTAKTVGAALQLIDSYLEENVHVLFQPILDYLSEQGAARSATEIETHFKNHMNLECATIACEWLADKDLIVKVSSPARLFEKGQVRFEEMAFYMGRGNQCPGLNPEGALRVGEEFM